MASYPQDFNNRQKPVPARRSGVSPRESPRNNMADPTSIGSRSAQAMAAAAMSMRGQDPHSMNDTKAKTVLKEAVDAVVNSFAKHTQGYGRGNMLILLINLYFFYIYQNRK